MICAHNTPEQNIATGYLLQIFGPATSSHSLGVPLPVEHYTCMGKVSYKPIAVSCKGRAKYSRLNTELVPSRDGRGRWIACLVTVLTSWRGLTQRCCWCAGYKEARFARWGKGGVGRNG